MKETRFTYSVVGDYKIYDKIHSCLIYACGTDINHANNLLAKALVNPPADCLGNIRLEKEPISEAWYFGKVD